MNVFLYAHVLCALYSCVFMHVLYHELCVNTVCMYVCMYVCMHVCMHMQHNIINTVYVEIFAVYIFCG